MYCHVAAGALTTGLKSQAAMRDRRLGVEAGVALEAEHPAFAPHQHEVIGAAVGIVTDHTAFHPHRRVLIDVGPAFFNVALDAGFPVGGVQAGTIDATVRVMAIRTLHQALGHPVVYRQGELRLDVAMAGEAQIRFGFLEQTAVQASAPFQEAAAPDRKPPAPNSGRLCFDL